MIHRFQDFHPFLTFFYYCGAILLIMLFQHPTILSVVLFIILVIHFIDDGFRSLRRWRVLIFTTGILILVLNPLFNERGRNVLFEVFGHRVTLEALIYGGITALSIITIIALFVSYNEVMTPNKLLFLFSKFLPQFAILLMLTLRFIPLMKRRLEDISAVQQSKGISVHEGKWRSKAKNGLLYVQVLLTYSLEEAIQTADSMNAREYGQGKRSTYEHFRFKKSDGIALAFLSILIFILLMGRFNGYGYLTIYPVMGSLQLSALEWFYVVVLSLFYSFPLLVEGGGYLKWRLLKSII
ncbi:energy-coupling factor transporter transmembrane component T [Evansella tamaricis]|uniref:Energy-coupling factor transporter transmembrane protein EcfT n=1 Tax=Evansella tamaricis TaxID=2069301 RepID=A0ABS6JEA0_9BACI|nr:energy-coupling factor transporter transmembrane component T [Evansella tamaricis]MBU9712006.1 energy-coupling factor transporter transmembrane protein EcfT [Evansella tamaricis]